MKVPPEVGIDKSISGRQIDQPSQPREARHETARIRARSTESPLAFWTPLLRRLVYRQTIIAADAVEVLDTILADFRNPSRSSFTRP